MSGAAWWIAAWAAAGLPLGVLVRTAIRHFAVVEPAGAPCPGRGAPPSLLAQLLTGAAFALSAWIALTEDGPASARVLRALGLCWLATFALAAVWIDALVQRLPDRLVLPAGAGTIVLCCAAAFCNDRPSVAGRVILAAMLAATVFLLLALFAGIGIGDAKLAAALGAALGYTSWNTVWRGAVLAFLLAGCFAGLRLLTGRTGRGDRLALGPFLYAGSVLALCLR